MADDRLPEPPYAAAAPGDTLGLRYVVEALADLDYPITTTRLRERAGNWRAPITGAIFRPLSDYLEGVPEKTFRSSRQVARAVGRAHPELRE